MAFDPVTAALEVGNKLIDHFFPDATKQAEAREKLLELQQKGALAELASETSLAQAQADINKIEAASTNWFVAGWRPAVGWCCAAGLLYETIAEPMARFIAVTIIHYTGTFPDIGTGLLTATLTGMLGLGGMRTYEKIKGAEGNR